MGIWIVLALMTGAAILLLLLPLANSRAGVETRPDDVAFYKAQIAEIARDAEAGLIGVAEAEAARAEAARRLLRADGGQSSPAKIRPSRSKGASFVALLLVPAVALPFYIFHGAPSLPGQPLAERRSADPATLDVADAVTRIEAHLAKNPDDGRGYDVVAPVYFRMERYADAARAWSEANRLLGENVLRLSSIGEALAAQSGGIIAPEAKAAFQRALAIDPEHVKSRFYLAMAREQDGDKDGAIADFEAMVKSAPADALWVDVVRERIANLRGKPAGAPVGGEAIAALPPQEREVAIRSMVDGLEARLNNQGGSLDEWLRLIRASAVLGDKDRALKALAAAREKLQTDANAVGALDALAKELGLQT